MSNGEYEEHIRCPVCDNDEIYVFFELEDIPVHCNLLWDTKETAIAAPKGDVHLGFCKQCGHIFNTIFDPGKTNYDEKYENALYFSSVFKDYADHLLKYLIERFDLHDKCVIDIGCGQGNFLSGLCHAGHNRGIGFDPGYRELASDHENGANIQIIRDFYGKKYQKYEADLIYSRQVLEHVPQPYQFAQSIHETVVKKKTPVFIEVPNISYTLRDLAVWDIIYEHYSYFNKESLITLFNRANFKIEKVYELYYGQFIGIEAIPVEDNVPVTHSKKQISDLLPYVNIFNRRYSEKKQYWLERIYQWEKDSRPFILWGSGSKGVMFLNELGLFDQMQYVIDINPRKQGKYVAGTGQKIMHPEFLKKFDPDTVIIMNPIYLNEIKQTLEEMGLEAELMPVQ